MSGTNHEYSVIIERLNGPEIQAERAFKELFLLLFKPVWKFTYDFVRSHEVAEEITNDVLYQLWKSRERLKGIENVKYYAFVASKNRCINYLKKKTGKNTMSIDEVNVEMYIDDADPELIFLHDELKNYLETIIDQLPRQCKLVFKLIKEEGFSYKEVGELLGISTRTVNVHMVNAVKQLTFRLKSQYKV